MSAVVGTAEKAQTTANPSSGWLSEKWSQAKKLGSDAAQAASEGYREAKSGAKELWEKPGETAGRWGSDLGAGALHAIKSDGGYALGMAQRAAGQAAGWVGEKAGSERLAKAGSELEAQGKATRAQALKEDEKFEAYAKDHPWARVGSAATDFAVTTAACMAAGAGIGAVGGAALRAGAGAVQGAGRVAAAAAEAPGVAKAAQAAAKAAQPAMETLGAMGQKAAALGQKAAEAGKPAAQALKSGAESVAETSQRIAARLAARNPEAAAKAVEAAKNGAEAVSAGLKKAGHAGQKGFAKAAGHLEAHGSEYAKEAGKNASESFANNFYQNSKKTDDVKAAFAQAAAMQVAETVMAPATKLGGDALKAKSKSMVFRHSAVAQAGNDSAKAMTNMYKRKVAMGPQEKAENYSRAELLRAHLEKAGWHDKAGKPLVDAAPQTMRERIRLEAVKSRASGESFEQIDKELKESLSRKGKVLHAGIEKGSEAAVKKPAEEAKKALVEPVASTMADKSQLAALEAASADEPFKIDPLTRQSVSDFRKKLGEMRQGKAPALSEPAGAKHAM